MNEARKLLRRIVIKWLIQAHQGHADGRTGAQPAEGGDGAMRHHVKVARCNCGAMDRWPDRCHHWTAVCTCGWSDYDADDQPGGIEAAYWHLAHRMTPENVHQRHADGLTGAQPSADTPNGSQALTGPHSDSLDRNRAADIYNPLQTAHNESREDC